jgi:prepilin-type N-terminal cleavage/methylation domain-containing protein
MSYIFKDNKKGFTLLELMFVVVIMAVAITLTVAKVDFLIPKYRLRGALREIASTVRLARVKATSIAMDLYIQYDLSNNEYWLLVPGKEEETIRYEKLLKKRLPTGISFKNVIVTDKTGESSGISTIKVSPFGIRGSHIVNLIDKDGRIGALKINGFTGSATFYNEEKEPDELLEDPEY